MAISFNKRELEKKREEKRQKKQKRKEERKANANGVFEDMIAYIDENGAISSSPPDPVRKQEIEIDKIAVSTPKKEDMEQAIQKGHVEYFNSDKGYGFIKDATSVNKYFFHISSAPVSIKEGNKVTFELERAPKGMNAVRIAFI
jgi:cold shock CspA family protein